MSSGKEENDMNKSLELTGRGKEVYQFLVAYFKKYGYAPSLREIGEGVGLKSTSAVKHQLDNLERKKKIRKQDTARAIGLIEYTFVLRKK